MTEVISKDEALKALERRMEKQPMNDEYLFGVYNGLKCAKGIIVKRCPARRRRQHETRCTRPIEGWKI